jgi:hypothetical protein
MSIKLKNATKPSTSTPDNRRAKLLSTANEMFLEKYKMIQDALASEETTIFENRYKIGLIVEEMNNLESDYGSKPVERMAELLGSGKDIIYQSLLFVQRFDEDELKALIAMRNTDGNPLMWTHVSHIIRIADRDIRKDTIQKCLDNSWTPVELLSYIQELRGGKQRSSSGKPLARPKSLRGFIEQQNTFIDQLLKRKEKVWAGQEKAGDHSFLDLMKSTPTDSYNKSVFTDIDALVERYRIAATEMDSMAIEIDRVKRQIIESIQFVEQEKETPDSDDYLNNTDDEDDLHKYEDDEPELSEEPEDEEEPAPAPVAVMTRTKAVAPPKPIKRKVN